MTHVTIILDLDGVLITTPSWKADELDSDGYSKFNESCVENFNTLLERIDAKIWLSSTRRTKKTLSEFNLIFKHRKIIKQIDGFIPEFDDCVSRKEEILKFIDIQQPKNYLIIDDDKSLNDLHLEMKQRLVLTELLKGFGKEELKKAITLIENKHNNKHD